MPCAPLRPRDQGWPEAGGSESRGAGWARGGTHELAFSRLVRLCALRRLRSVLGRIHVGLLLAKAEPRGDDVHVRVGVGQSPVVRRVEALELVRLGHAEGAAQLHAVEEEEARGEAVQGDHDDRKELIRQLHAVAAVEDARKVVQGQVLYFCGPAAEFDAVGRVPDVGVAQQPAGDHRPHAGPVVQRGGAEGVVHRPAEKLAAKVDVEPEAEAVGEHGDGGDDPKGGPDSGAAARGADANHGGEDAGHGLLERGVLLGHVAPREGDAPSRAAREGRHHAEAAELEVDVASGAADEGDEAEPEDEEAEAHHRHVVLRQLDRLEVDRHERLRRPLDESADPRPECLCTHPGGAAGEGVDGVAARVVADAPRVDEAVRVPRPVRGERIDEAGEEEGVDEVSAELDPLGDRARDDGRDGGGEDVLEEEDVVLVLLDIDEHPVV
mmetsp:Transcript_12197/g.40173  ORF Transcript_12197/g.40173 Transcript_12197/m.40173 type:complete len:439 (+) Transcript_12197:386-1702(+)